MSKILKVINLFGAPGMGKSGAAGGLFWLMKGNHYSVELVPEYAKYLIHAGRASQLEDEQYLVLAKQYHMLSILKNKYEFAITDSPLQLCAFYEPGKLPPSYFELLDKFWGEFDCTNFFLSRDLSAEDAAFENEGRLHKKEDSIKTEGVMRNFLAKKNIGYTELPINMKTPWLLLDAIRKQ